MDARADEEIAEQQWRQIRGRLEAKLGPRSGLVAPLAAYATDHLPSPSVDGVRGVRAEYGVAGDPSAEDLVGLLYYDAREAAGS